MITFQTHSNPNLNHESNQPHSNKMLTHPSLTSQPISLTSASSASSSSSSHPPPHHHQPFSDPQHEPSSSSSPPSHPHQPPSAVLDELNLMLGEAIDSAHSAFSQLHHPFTDELRQTDVDPPSDQVPPSNSYSSLLLSVKKRIQANKLERLRLQQETESLSIHHHSSLDDSFLPAPQQPTQQPPLLMPSSPQHTPLMPRSRASSLSNYSVPDLPESDREAVIVNRDDDAFTPSPGSPPISSSLLESMNSEHGPTSTLVTSTSQLSLLDDLKLSSIPTSVQATPKPLPPSSQPVTLGSSPISKSSHQSPHAPQPIHTYPQILSLTSPTSSTSRDPAPHSSHPLSPPVITYQPSLPLTDSSSSSNIPTRTRSTTSSSSYSPSPAITRSSSGVSVLHQWQWLDANQSFDPQGTPRATSGTGDPKSELTATERRLQALDAYYRSGSGSQDIPLKQTLLTSRQQWLNDCISLTRDHHKSKVSLVHPSVGSINPKELKKTKSTVDRCKVYISNTHQIQSQPTGLDLWLWYKTMNDTLQPTAVPPSVPCASPLNLLSKRPGGDQAPEHRITNVNANQTQVSRPPINKLDYSRSVSHQPIQSNLGSKIHPPSPIPHHIQQLQHPLPHLQSPPHPHSRDVSHGSGSSVMSFPARSDAQKAIEITEKGGERLMEIINPPSGLSAAPGINPLIQVTNLPFPGLYQHGVVRIPALVRPEASPLPPPAPEQISKPASETLDFSGFNFKGPPPPPEPSSGRGQAVLPTTRTGGFFSQLGRRNSHKRPQNVLTHTGPRDRIGMISSPITATHNPWPTGGGPEALRSGMPPRGPRPLGARAIGTAALPGQTRFKSISGSTPPSQVIEAESSASLPSALKLLKSTRLSRHRSSFAYGTSSHHKPEPQPTTTLQSLMRHGAEERGGPEWDAKILKLMDILPQASRKSLEQVLANEHGDDVAAIGAYLELESTKPLR